MGDAKPVMRFRGSEVGDIVVKRVVVCVVVVVVAIVAIIQKQNNDK